MNQAIAKGESAVQDAIVAALAEYCYAERLRFRHTLPYSNQQGFKPGRVCADMAAVLSDHTLLILEVKAAAALPPKLALDAFTKVKNQWENYVYLEQLFKVPVHYAFNTVETLAHATPAPFSPFMCVQTLCEIGLAKPSAVSLAGKVGEVACNLFQYLRAPKTGSSEDAAIALLGFLAAPLSNSVLVLAFAPDAGVLALGAEQLRELYQQMLNAPQEIDADQFPGLFKYLKKSKVIDSATSRNARTDTTAKIEIDMGNYMKSMEKRLEVLRSRSDATEARQQKTKAVNAAKPTSKR